MSLNASDMVTTARDLLERVDPMTAGLWPRAAALLTRRRLCSHTAAATPAGGLIVGLLSAACVAPGAAAPTKTKRGGELRFIVLDPE